MYVAERGGFEPPVEYYPTHAFQACAFSRSAISPANFFRFHEAADYSKNCGQNQNNLVRALPATLRTLP
jgi:hypothetical protein